MNFKVSKRLLKVVKNDLSNCKYSYYPGGFPSSFNVTVDHDKLKAYLSKLEIVSWKQSMDGKCDDLRRKRYIDLAVAYITTYGNLDNEIKKYLIRYADEDTYNEIISSVKRDETIEIYNEFKY